MERFNYIFFIVFCTVRASVDNKCCEENNPLTNGEDVFDIPRTDNDIKATYNFYNTKGSVEICWNKRTILNFQSNGDMYGYVINSISLQLASKKDETLVKTQNQLEPYEIVEVNNKKETLLFATILKNDSLTVKENFTSVCRNGQSFAKIFIQSPSKKNMQIKLITPLSASLPDSGVQQFHTYEDPSFANDFLPNIFSNNMLTNIDILPKPISKNSLSDESMQPKIQQRFLHPPSTSCTEKETDASPSVPSTDSEGTVLTPIYSEQTIFSSSVQPTGLEQRILTPSVSPTDSEQTVVTSLVPSADSEQTNLASSSSPTVSEQTILSSSDLPTASEQRILTPSVSPTDSEETVLTSSVRSASSEQTILVSSGSSASSEQTVPASSVSSAGSEQTVSTSSAPPTDLVQTDLTPLAPLIGLRKMIPSALKIDSKQSIITPSVPPTDSGQTVFRSGSEQPVSTFSALSTDSDQAVSTYSVFPSDSDQTDITSSDFSSTGSGETISVPLSSLTSTEISEIISEIFKTSLPPTKQEFIEDLVTEEIPTAKPIPRKSEPIDLPTSKKTITQIENDYSPLPESAEYEDTVSFDSTESAVTEATPLQTDQVVIESRPGFITPRQFSATVDVGSTPLIIESTQLPIYHKEPQVESESSLEPIPSTQFSFTDDTIDASSPPVIQNREFLEPEKVAATRINKIATSVIGNDVASASTLAAQVTLLPTIERKPVSTASSTSISADGTTLFMQSLPLSINKKISKVGVKTSIDTVKQPPSSNNLKLVEISSSSVSGTNQPITKIPTELEIRNNVDEAAVKHSLGKTQIFDSSVVTSNRKLEGTSPNSAYASDYYDDYSGQLEEQYLKDYEKPSRIMDEKMCAKPILLNNQEEDVYNINEKVANNIPLSFNTHESLNSFLKLFNGKFLERTVTVKVNVLNAECDDEGNTLIKVRVTILRDSGNIETICKNVKSNSEDFINKENELNTPLQNHYKNILKKYSQSCGSSSYPIADTFEFPYRQPQGISSFRNTNSKIQSPGFSPLFGVFFRGKDGQLHVVVPPKDEKLDQNIDKKLFSLDKTEENLSKPKFGIEGIGAHYNLPAISDYFQKQLESQWKRPKVNNNKPSTLQSIWQNLRPYLNKYIKK